MATADCRTSPKPAVARDGLGLLLLWIASASISWIPASSCARAFPYTRWPVVSTGSFKARSPNVRSESVEGSDFDRLRLLLGGEGKRVKLQLRLLVA
jgi:hypothetical protein